MIVARTAVLWTATMLAAGLMAEDVKLEISGTLRCLFGGRITAEGLINYDNWNAYTRSAPSASNRAEYVLSSRGNVFAVGRWMLGSDGAGGVTATNTFTMMRDVVSQAAHSLRFRWCKTDQQSGLKQMLRLQCHCRRR